jgi:hypothetical protein
MPHSYGMTFWALGFLRTTNVDSTMMNTATATLINKNKNIGT